MSLKDKLEIGLKPDAPFRKDNLPDFQKDDPACDAAATPSDTPSVERARKDCATPPVKQEQVAKERRSNQRLQSTARNMEVLSLASCAHARLDRDRTSMDERLVLRLRRRCP